MSCGGCGIPCPAGATCNDSQCNCANPNDIICDDECVSPQVTEHCGSCDNECDVDEECLEGQCCYQGFQICDGQCTNTLYDPTNCGGCEIACEAFEICDAGGCVEDMSGTAAVGAEQQSTGGVRAVSPELVSKGDGDLLVDQLVEDSRRVPCCAVNPVSSLGLVIGVSIPSAFDPKRQAARSKEPSPAPSMHGCLEPATRDVRYESERRRTSASCSASSILHTAWSRSRRGRPIRYNGRHRRSASSISRRHSGA